MKFFNTRNWAALPLALMVVTTFSAGTALAKVPASFYVGKEPTQVFASKETMVQSNYDKRPLVEALKIDENVYTYRRDNHRTIFVVTDEGVIVMDPMKPSIANGMHQQIRKITDKPIKYMIYSHNHWDHARGGKVFKDEGAVVIAHEETAKEMKKWPDPDMVQPDLTWSGESHKLSLGGVELELYHFGPSHGKGLTFFYFPQKKLLHVIDVISPNRLPPGIEADFTPKGILVTLKKVLELDFERAIPSHTPYVLAGRNAVTDMIDYWNIIIANARATLEKYGDDVPPWFLVEKIPPVEKYKHWNMYEEFGKGTGARALWELYYGY